MKTTLKMRTTSKKKITSNIKLYYYSVSLCDALTTAAVGPFFGYFLKCPTENQQECSRFHQSETNIFLDTTQTHTQQKMQNFDVVSLH